MWHQQTVYELTRIGRCVEALELCGRMDPHAGRASQQERLCAFRSRLWFRLGEFEIAVEHARKVGGMRLDHDYIAALCFWGMGRRASAMTWLVHTALRAPGIALVLGGVEPYDVRLLRDGAVARQVDEDADAVGMRHVLTHLGAPELVEVIREGAGAERCGRRRQGQGQEAPSRPNLDWAHARRIAQRLWPTVV